MIDVKHGRALRDWQAWNGSHICYCIRKYDEVWCWGIVEPRCLHMSHLSKHNTTHISICCLWRSAGKTAVETTFLMKKLYSVYASPKCSGQNKIRIAVPNSTWENSIAGCQYRSMYNRKLTMSACTVWLRKRNVANLTLCLVQGLFNHYWNMHCRKTCPKSSSKHLNNDIAYGKMKHIIE